MGRLDGRMRRLEGLMPEVLRDAQEEERTRRQRAITRMILDEFARLKASGLEASLKRSVRNVVEEQYEDLSEESRQYIADGWIETIRSWTRLDWMVSAASLPFAPMAMRTTTSPSQLLSSAGRG
jgi:hypothetical protein